MKGEKSGGRAAHPCFLCPAKYVEEEFDDDDVDEDCPDDDDAAESTPRLRCDGIAGKHETLLLRLYLLKNALFAKSEEISLSFSAHYGSVANFKMFT